MDAESSETGDFVYKKVLVPNELWTLLEEVAKVMDATPKWCLGMLMKRIDHLASTRPEVLGFEFERARRQLDGRGSFVSGELRQIDQTRLHRGERTKSGFVGVYANGKGFTAMAKASHSDPTMKSLGTFPTAVQAAEARRMHYFKLSLPYGSLAERIETFKHSEAWKNASDELKRRQAIYELAKEGTPAEGLSDEDRKWETIDPLEAEMASAPARGASRARQQ